MPYRNDLMNDTTAFDATSDNIELTLLNGMIIQYIYMRTNRAFIMFVYVNVLLTETIRFQCFELRWTLACDDGTKSLP